MIVQYFFLFTISAEYIESETLLVGNWYHIMDGRKEKHFGRSEERGHEEVKDKVNVSTIFFGLGSIIVILLMCVLASFLKFKRKRRVARLHAQRVMDARERERLLLKSRKIIIQRKILSVVSWLFCYLCYLCYLCSLYLVTTVRVSPSK